MTWAKAIEKIENILDEGTEVEIRYHRKWARNCNEFKYATVDSVGTYKWHGEDLKCVHCHFDILDEGTHIIDEVTDMAESIA